MTGNIEGVHFLAGNALLPLSEQQLTSCDRTGDDGGCKGSATVLDTFKYVVDNGGIASELGYPLCSANYTCPPAPGCDPESGKNSCKKQRKSGVCNDQLESRPVANISGYFQVSGGVKHWAPGVPLPVNETAMMEVLVRSGPISVAVNSKYFDHYKRGVLSKSRCKGGLNQLDHEVLLVGYGVSSDDDAQAGVPYWKIKNSWAADCAPPARAPSAGRTPDPLSAEWCRGRAGVHSASARRAREPRPQHLRRGGGRILRPPVATGGAAAPWMRLLYM